MDASGLLIASSTPEPITTGQGENTALLSASESTNRLIRDTVDYLQEEYQGLELVESSQLNLFGKRNAISSRSRVLPSETGN